uniref:DUF5641 domain-containing protein n=1 Tax=Amphimedon queenslandica TaxID=400682 RepID=A0A1X7UAA3_AMPQE
MVSVVSRIFDPIGIASTVTIQAKAVGSIATFKAYPQCGEDRHKATFSICYSDSEVVLYWIMGENRDWKPFAQNQVREIRSLAPVASWRHCPGEENSADLATRGVSDKELKKTWWLLWSSMNSSLEKLCRVTEFVLRFIDSIKRSNIEHNLENYSLKAEYMWVVECQKAEGDIQCARTFTSPQLFERGFPTKVISDNTKTFKGAAVILQKIVKHPHVSRYFSDLNAIWAFNVAKAPWWGGIFERLIQFVKLCLKTIRRAKLTHEELLTLQRDVHRFHNQGSTGPNIAVGDVVVIHNEDCKRGFWNLGRIKELIPGSDGHNCAVVVVSNGKGKTMLLKRPVQRLFPYEVRNVSSTEVTSTEPRVTGGSDAKIMSLPKLSLVQRSIL